MEKIKVLIADDIEDTRKVIKKILNLEEDLFEIVGEASNGEEVLKAIPRVKPQVVLMDINMPIINGLEATERISDEFPSVIVIIMSVQGENEYLKKAMFSGAKEYIIKPFNYDNLVNTIKNTYEKHKEKIIKQGLSKEKLRDAKIISYFSSKGGVGKSLLALNSSITLSKKMNKKTLLIDMDLQFGDVAILINAFNEKTILDIVEDGEVQCYEDLKPYLCKYNENLDMIFAPGRPEAAEYVTKNIVEKVIKYCREQYDIIIIDTGVNFNDNTLCVLDNSSLILYISTMEIVSIKNTKLGLSVMNSLGYDKNKVKVVINRYDTRYGISKRDIEEVFKESVFAILPNEEKTVTLSVNNGIPFCAEEKLLKSKIGKSITAICEGLCK